MRKLTYEQIQSVAGLPSRDAARQLGVGKSTVNEARQALRDGTLDQGLPNGSVVLEVSGISVPKSKAEIEDAFHARGLNPKDYTVTHRFGTWGRDGDAQSSYRAVATPLRNAIEIEDLGIDPIELLCSLRANLAPARPVPMEQGDGAFVFCLNDTQFGKVEIGGGGTPATLARIENAIEGAIWRVVQLRKMGYQLGTLVVIGGGDIIEGCTIYPHQAFHLDLDRRGQINTAVATIQNVIDRLGIYFDKITVLACKGNHGEHRVNGKSVSARDNDDALVFEMAKLAYDREKGSEGSIGSRITWVIADDEVGVTTEVAGWVLGTTHGDQLGAGRFPFQKVLESMKRWALGRMPLGRCDVLVTHHYHHEQQADFGAWEWEQTRAQDDGSKHFESVTGMYSGPGSLTFIMTPTMRKGEKMYV